MTSTRTPAFDRFAAAVADFASPFYAEERQRDVWNEASAFGFQLMLWLSWLLVGTMYWFGGRPLAGYATALLLLVGLASGLTLTYARRLGVVVDLKSTGVSRGRLVVLLVVVGYLLSGLFATQWPRDGSWSTVVGAVAGGLVGVAVLVALARRRREPDEDGDAADG